MMADNINTDKRLLLLLGAGNIILALKDPQGLLDSPSVTLLEFNDQSRTWKMNLAFQKGTVLCIAGCMSENDYMITMITAGDKSYQAESAKTLSEALKDLSRIPAWIRPYLSRETKRSINKEEAEKETKLLLACAKDAVFYNIEGGKSEQLRNRFRKWKFRFFLSEEDEPIKVEITTEVKTKSSSLITTSVEADIYGIGNKKVTLSKHLGFNHYANVACFTKYENKTVPSLTVAFDLDKAMPELYRPTQPQKSKIIDKRK